MRPDKLNVEVVTAERVVYAETDVDMVVAPGAEGSLGILPKHAPLFSLLSAGEMRIKKAGQEQSIVVFGGFLEVANNRILILADTAERVEEIDIQRAEEARQRAEARLSQRGQAGGLDLALAEASMQRAAVRLRVAQRRQSGRARPGPTDMRNP
ncbi:MAG TPA: F0F1 ATP synthase subunit epsilon [Thermomicrobiales bacterium]|nr:F0F1 ATP synthase subunit epsilon [Thermomicrobiales bacterium]